MLEVLEPGLQSTVQDEGRPDGLHLGLRRAGAADRRALAASNLLVGGHDHDAAIEMTLLGATFAVRRTCVVGLAGADMGIRVPEEGRTLDPGRGHRLAAGTTLACGGAIDGARTYLALAGGLVADRLLGSASTDLAARVGGIEGRSLRTGDLLVPARSVAVVRERTWPGDVPSSGVGSGPGPRVVGVTPGPLAPVVSPRLVEALAARTWTVSARSDRVGVRLDGAALPAHLLPGGDLISIPMLPGAVQVPPDGRPIVLSVDAPTVGGYPVPVVVIEADLPVIGQLRPGDELRFELLEAREARQRAVAARADLARAAGSLASA
jgi:antagonist of KipI